MKQRIVFAIDQVLQILLVVFWALAFASLAVICSPFLIIGALTCRSQHPTA